MEEGGNVYGPGEYGCTVKKRTSNRSEPNQNFEMIPSHIGIH